MTGETQTPTTAEAQAAELVALKGLNEAQKAFDSAAFKLNANPSAGSEWSQTTLRRLSK